MIHLYHHRIRRGILAGTFMIGMGVLNAAPAHAQVLIPCVVSLGVTQIGNIVTGTALDDNINCSAASPGKTINGLSGNDTITGSAFSDTINGGLGNDSITGGPATAVAGDTINGGIGNDTMTGNAGNDTMTGGLSRPRTAEPSGSGVSPGRLTRRAPCSPQRDIALLAGCSPGAVSMTILALRKQGEFLPLRGYVMDMRRNGDLPDPQGRHHPPLPAGDAHARLAART